MPVLRVHDTSPLDPEPGGSEGPRHPSEELERIRARANERGSSAEELTLGLALALALARRERAETP